jgi:hypothetical protein
MQPDQASLFRAILDSSLRLPGLDGGGLYWRQRRWRLRAALAHQGFSTRFVAAIGDSACRIPPGRDHTQRPTGLQLQRCRQSLQQARTGALHQLVAEGIRALVVLPIMVEGEALACLNLASRSQAATPVNHRHGIRDPDPPVRPGVSRRRASRRQQSGNAKITLPLVRRARRLHLRRRPRRQGAALQRCGIRPPGVWSKFARSPADRGASAGNCTAKRHGSSATSWPGRISLLSTADPQSRRQPDPVDTRVVHGSWNGQAAIFGVSRDITGN